MSVLTYNDATDGVERQITVSGDPLVIGRSPECGIRSNDPRLSRQHARFYKGHDGNVYIEDLGSSNGVYLGQNRVQHAAVPIGELVTIGNLTFRVLPDGQPAGYGQQPYGQDPYAQQPQPAYAPDPYAQQQPAYAPDPYAQQQAYGQQPYAQPQAAPQMAPPQMPPPQMPPPQMAPPQMPQMAPPQMPPSPSVIVSSQAADAYTDIGAPPDAPPALPHQRAETQPAAPQFDGAISHLLEVERKARMAAEEERDAYGARMAQLHGEVRAAKDAAAAAEATATAAKAAAAKAEANATAAKAAATTANAAAAAANAAAAAATAAAAAAANRPQAPLPKQISDAAIKSPMTSGEIHLQRLAVDDAEDRAKAAEARVAGLEDELTVARADLSAADDRIITEVAAAEERKAAELQSRVEELEVARADLVQSEDRVMEAERKIADLKERLARLGVVED